MYLTMKSQKKLVGIHPQLAVFVFLVMKKMNERKENFQNYTDFSVFEGLRTQERQKLLFAQRKSQTLDSLHKIGLALDIVVYIEGIGLTWDDTKYANQWNVLMEVCEEVIYENKLEIDSAFKLWGWDKAHFQMTLFKNKFDSRELMKVYL